MRKCSKSASNVIISFCLLCLSIQSLFVSAFPSLNLPPRTELVMNQVASKDTITYSRDADSDSTDADTKETIIAAISECELASTIQPDNKSDEMNRDKSNKSVTSETPILNSDTNITDNDPINISSSDPISLIRNKCVNLLNVTLSDNDSTNNQENDNVTDNNIGNELMTDADINLTRNDSGANETGLINHNSSIGSKEETPTSNVQSSQSKIEESLFTLYLFDQESGSNESITIREINLSDQLSNSSNVSVVLEPDLMIHHPVLAVILSLICVTVIAGNILVMIAIKRERVLRTITNYFVASLAFADCLVGLIVMPVSIVHEIMNKYWIFGQDACDLWHSFDVLASTASILNLCVISMDR